MVTRPRLETEYQDPPSRLVPCYACALRFSVGLSGFYDNGSSSKFSAAGDEMKLKRFLLRYYPPGAERFSARNWEGERGRGSCGGELLWKESSAGKGGDDGESGKANEGCGETGRTEEDNGESEGGAAGRAIQREQGEWKCRRKDPEKRQRKNGGQSFTAPDFIVQLKLTRLLVDLKVNFSGA